MKKIISACVALSFLFGGASMVIAGSVGAGGVCSGTADCASGLTCTADPNGGFTATCTGTAVSGGTGLSASGQIVNPIKYNDFSCFVAAVLKTAVDILMPFVVLAFIWSGFLFVRAQGNEKELEEAKAAIKWSIVGAFILMGAWGFAQIISETITSITAIGTTITSCN